MQPRCHSLRSIESDENICISARASLVSWKQISDQQGATLLIMSLFQLPELQYLNFHRLFPSFLIKFNTSGFLAKYVVISRHTEDVNRQTGDSCDLVGNILPTRSEFWIQLSWKLAVSFVKREPVATDERIRATFLLDDNFLWNRLSLAICKL